MKKKTVAILFGGPSAERDVSFMSLKNIVAVLDTTLYDPVLVHIDVDRRWFVSNTDSAYSSDISVFTQEVYPQRGQLVSVDATDAIKIDVVFPVLHGTYGEDGVVQGLLEAGQFRYVGSTVMAAAVCMDKDVSKRLLQGAGLPVLPAIVVNTPIELASAQKRLCALRLPVFVKPANQGSSIGVHKVMQWDDLAGAVKEAFLHDNKVIIEPGVTAREIEISVLERGGRLETSPPGEIIVHTDFYDYQSKYHDESAVDLSVPATDLDESLVVELQAAARDAFSVLGCSGLARVDFFVMEDGSFVINEINTMPGFTNASMYPKSWEQIGLSATELVSVLIENASNVCTNSFSKNKN